MTQPDPLPTLVPFDLQHFLNAVLIASLTEGGFELDDVARVEEAWEIADLNLMSHGYIVDLVDGHRIYLEYTEDSLGAAIEETIEVVPLEPGMERPDLAGNAGGVHWYQASHITEYLTAMRGRPQALH